MTNITLCLVPEMKLPVLLPPPLPPSPDCFVELLVRKNSNVTRNPLFRERERRKKNQIKDSFGHENVSEWNILFSALNLPDEEKGINCKRCIAQYLKPKCLLADGFIVLFGVTTKSFMN